MVSWILTALTLGLAGPMAPAADDYAAFKAELENELVTGLEELVEWCSRKKVYRARAEVCTLILRYEPDHKEARKLLGHKRSGDGWDETPPRRPPKDFDKKATAAFPGRMAELVEPCVSQMESWLERSGRTLSFERREEVLDDLLAFSPDNAYAHGLRHEVQEEDGTWILKETRRAKEGRRRIKEVVRAAYAAAPMPTPIEPNEKELGFGIEWRASMGTDLARLHGTGQPQELIQVAGGLYAAHHTFRELLGVEGQFGPEFTVYLLAQRGDKDKFLAKHPVLTDQTRAALLHYEGSGIQGSDDFAHWATDPQKRVDATVHFALGWLMADAFGPGAQSSWLGEASALYLTRELVGSRLNWFAQPASYKPTKEDRALIGKLFHPSANWMAEAHRDLQKPGAPTILGLFEPHQGLSTRQLLLAYVFTAYLLESQPEVVRALFAAVKGEASLPQAFQQAMEIGTDGLDARLVRWIGERR